jgi:NADPH2:quinone reductase
VLKNGAAAVFNHKDEDYIQQIKASTKDGAGVDIVIEMLANVNLIKDLDVIKRSGVVVIVGSRGEISNFAPRYAPLVISTFTKIKIQLIIK